MGKRNPDVERVIDDQILEDEKSSYININMSTLAYCYTVFDYLKDDAEFRQFEIMIRRPIGKLASLKNSQGNKLMDTFFPNNWKNDHPRFKFALKRDNLAFRLTKYLAVFQNLVRGNMSMHSDFQTLVNDWLWMIWESLDKFEKNEAVLMKVIYFLFTENRNYRKKCRVKSCCRCGRSTAACTTIFSTGLRTVCRNSTRIWGHSTQGSYWTWQKVQPRVS
jgi:hypothetical protein